MPFLSYQGTPSASDTNAFGISTLDLIPGEFGLFIHGTNGASSLDPTAACRASSRPSTACCR